MTIYTHKHHIVPRHAGGDDSPENLIELTVEDHAIAHKVLYNLYGREEDRIAWLGLSGQITSEHANRLALSAVAKGNLWRKGKFHTDETKELIRQRGMGNANKKGKKVKWTKEGLESHIEHSRKRFTENNPMNNPEYRERVRQYALKKQQCPHCDMMGNPATLARHIKARHQ